MRLIDADALKKYKCSTCDNRERCEDRETVCSEIVDIDEQPTIETEPVKHGRWLFNGMILNRQKCSVCGFYSDDLQADNYCPNCGARMEFADND